MEKNPVIFLRLGGGRPFKAGGQEGKKAKRKAINTK
jgi:hypothetical protein